MSNKTEFKPLFSTGQIVITQGARAALHNDLDLISLLLVRHTTGDGGDLCAEDKESNTIAIKHGHRILSVYDLPFANTVWIITEADRSVTTLLLPSEY
jgi:hypothetical protein